MDTDALIRALAAGDVAVDPSIRTRRWLAGLAIGVVLAVAVMATVFGIRWEMTAQAGEPMLWVKFAYVGALSLGALALVARLSGDAQAAPPVPANAAADYAMAGPIARRRFDALATETAAFAAAGIEILLRQRSTRGGDCRVAAAQLATEMRTAMTAMMQVIERHP